jgi:hypothetical protein
MTIFIFTLYGAGVGAIGGGLLGAIANLRTKNSEQPIAPPAPSSGTGTEHSSPLPPPLPKMPSVKKVEKFAVNIPFNAANENVPIPLDENATGPNHAFYQELLSLTGRSAVSTDGQIQETRNFGDVSARAQFIRQLLRYYIFQSIDRLQRDGESYEWNIEKGARTVVRLGIPPPDEVLYPNEAVIAMLSQTPFFGSSGRLVWNRNHKFFVPRHTVVQFAEGPSYSSVQLRRDGYFEWEIRVTQSFGPIMVTGVPGASLPPGFKTSVPGAEGYPFVVTMNLQIEHPNDAGFRPDDYLLWGTSTFSALKEQMASN